MSASAGRSGENLSAGMARRCRMYSHPATAPNSPASELSPQPTNCSLERWVESADLEPAPTAITARSPPAAARSPRPPHRLEVHPAGRAAPEAEPDGAHGGGVHTGGPATREPEHEPRRPPLGPAGERVAEHRGRLERDVHDGRQPDHDQ